MTPKQARKLIDAAAEKYRVEIERIAEQITLENVAPFCEKHKTTFLPGLGTWTFQGGDAEPTPRRPAPLWSLWDTSELPKSLKDVLEIETLLSNGQQIGSLGVVYIPKSGAK